MILTLATAVLLLAASQADGEVRRTGDGTEPTAEEAVSPDTTRPTVTNDITGPPGVPFIPSVGTLAPRQGTFLDVALLSLVRARTLNGSSDPSAWGSDVEVTPGIALELGTPSLTLSVGYAPRLTVPFNVGSFELAVLNRATFRAEWRASERWTVTGLGLFVVGDFSQLVPASTPGGAGPPPPVLSPVRSFQTYPYVGIDTLLRVEGLLTPRSRLRIAGGYFDVGGTGAEGEANQPRTWGPQAEASFAWQAARTATLTTTATARNWMMTGNFSIFMATLTEGWKQSWSSDVDTTLSLGAGMSNQEIQSQTALGQVAPVAALQLDYHPVSLPTLGLTVDTTLAPYVDTYARIAYQRITLGVAFGWSPSDAWQVQANLLAALVPYTVRVPESYGTAGLSASYAPVKFLILSVGGFSQTQFQGPTDGGGAFRQWTTYFSVALRETIAF